MNCILRSILANDLNQTNSNLNVPTRSECFHKKRQSGGTFLDKRMPSIIRSWTGKLPDIMFYNFL